MPDLLLTTKYHVPQVRTQRVLRERLITRLQQGLAHKLILISAPAGYGKTTLVCEWLAACEELFAWVSLDKGDNDPARFWAYILTALQTAFSSAGKSLPEVLLHPKPPIDEALIANLVNALDTLEQPLVLVLDDYHNIEAQVIHEGLSFLLEHAPARFHLALLTRADPPLPLARLRARSQMVEIRLADLRFSSQEVEEFLIRIMLLELSKTDIELLDASTEGWIAGVQMAGLSLQGRKDASSFIRSFSGEDRYIMDFLFEEVFQRQSEELQNFLLQTSILEYFSAPLCNAVTAQTDSSSILKYLEQSNLFIIPLDSERRWYRYHHLFADLLVRRLEQTQPEQVVLLHRRAAEWYENEGLMTEAVNHALAGKDNDRLMRLVEANVYSLNPSDQSHVSEQLSVLPDDITSSQPWVLIARARALLESGHPDQVEPCLQKAEAAVEGYSPQTETEMARMRGYIAAIRGYHLLGQGMMPQGVEFLRSSLEILPMEDAATRSLAATVLSTSLRWTGHLTESSKYGEEAVAMARSSGSVNALVDVLADLAILQIMQGKLKQAAETCRSAMEAADTSPRPRREKLPVLGPIYTAFSVILREWNEINAALEYAQEGLFLCQRWGQVPNIFRAYFDLAKTLHVSGDDENAVRAIEEAEKIARGFSPWMVDRAAVLRPWRHLMKGNIPAAVLWEQTSGLRFDDQFKFEYFEHYSLLEKVLLAEGRVEEALALSNRLLEMADSAGAGGYTVEVLAIQALIFFRISGDGSDKKKTGIAIACLERALALAEPEGFMRAFVEKGAPMAALLRLARSHHLMPTYVNRLLHAIESELRGEKVHGTELPTEQGLQLSPLLEPLSEREMDVLRLLAQGCSDKKIAETLVIARETVHKHLKNIYGKLGVHSRGEAVIRARELGLF